MIYCITIITVVALICATRLYPLWLRHDALRYRKAIDLLNKSREENAILRKDLEECYSNWLEDFDRREKRLEESIDLLIRIAKRIDLEP